MKYNIVHKLIDNRDTKKIIEHNLLSVKPFLFDYYNNDENALLKIFEFGDITLINHLLDLKPENLLYQNNRKNNILH